MNNHIFEMESLKNSDLQWQNMSQQEILLKEALEEKEVMKRALEEMKFHYEEDTQNLAVQLEEMGKDNFQAI